MLQLNRLKRTADFVGVSFLSLHLIPVRVPHAGTYYPADAWGPK